MAPVSLGEAAGVGERSGLDLLPGHLAPCAEPGEEAGALARVRGEEGDGIRPGRQHVGVEQVEAAGVDDDRLVAAERARARRRAGPWLRVARDATSSPGPDDPGLHPPGAVHRLGHRGPDQPGRGRRADVAHHAARRPRPRP